LRAFCKQFELVGLKDFHLSKIARTACPWQARLRKPAQPALSFPALNRRGFSPNLINPLLFSTLILALFLT
jgi:hypothetical protein